MKTTKSAVKKTASNKVEWPLLDFLELTPKQVGKSSKILGEMFKEELILVLGKRGKWKIVSEIEEDAWTFRCTQKKDTITLTFRLDRYPCHNFVRTTAERVRKEYVIRLTGADAYIDKLDQFRTLTGMTSIPMFVKRGEKVKGNIPGLLSILASAVSSYTSTVNKVDKLNGCEIVPTNTECDFTKYSTKISNDRYGYTLASILADDFSDKVKILFRSPNNWIFLRQEDMPKVSVNNWWSEKEGSYITTHCIDNEVVELKLGLQKKSISVSVSKWKKPKEELTGEDILKAKKTVVVNKEVVKFESILGKPEKYIYDWKAWKKVVSKSLTLWV